MRLECGVVLVPGVDDVCVFLFAVLDEVIDQRVRLGFVSDVGQFLLNTLEFGHFFRFDNQFGDECHLH